MREIDRFFLAGKVKEKHLPSEGPHRKKGSLRGWDQEPNCFRGTRKMSPQVARGAPKGLVQRKRKVKNV